LNKKKGKAIKEKRMKRIKIKGKNGLLERMHPGQVQLAF
jgi:hypothetical protein